MTSKTDNQKLKEKRFDQRLDFYWQYLSVYAIILVAYSILKGSIKEGSITIAVSDPIVILLSALVIFSLVSLLYNLYKRRSITTGPDYIIFHSRFGTKQFFLKDIKSISVGREKMIKVRRGMYKVIRMRVASRRMAIRIRPSLFWKELKLVEEIARLKKDLKKLSSENAGHH